MQQTFALCVGRIGFLGSGSQRKRTQGARKLTLARNLPSVW
ncbi:hypothetical protein ABVF61_16870 [Roseibium sp. HPY-6]